jgi:hypothetical protein
VGVAEVGQLCSEAGAEQGGGELGVVRPSVINAESRRRGMSSVACRLVSVVATVSNTAAAAPSAVAVTSGR